jgi:hypothetical protein
VNRRGWFVCCQLSVTVKLQVGEILTCSC